MQRFEITGRNGRNASLDQIRDAIAQAGGKRVSRRRAYGWSNQPEAITFAAVDVAQADSICKRAADALWPGDGSCMATLLASPYSES